MSRGKNSLSWTLLFLIGLASSVFVIRAGNALPYVDEQHYWKLAHGLSHGKGFVNINDNGEPTAFRPPAYPFLLAAFQFVSSEPILPKFGNVVFLLAASWLLADFARTFSSSPTSAPLCLLLLVFFPIFQYTCGTLYPQVFGSFLFVLSLFLLVRFRDRSWATFLSGFVYGLLILAISSFLLILPVVLVYIGWPGGGEPSRRRGIQVATFAAVVCATLAPWVIRNSLCFHRFIPVSTNSGLMLILGNSENTTPNAGPTADISKYKDATEGMTEVETDAFLRRNAVRWVLQNPGKSVPLYLLKTLNNFNYRNNLATKSESSTGKDVVSFLTYYPLLALALLRLFYRKAYAMSQAEMFLYALYIANAFIGAIFFTRVRYRIPFDFLLIAIDAAFLGWWLDSVCCTRHDPSGETAQG